MWGRFVTHTFVWFLKTARIGNEERQLLTSAVLDKIHALPLRARVVIDEVGKIYVDGKPANFEQTLALRDGAKVMMGNYALKFVREQVRFLAVENGVHQNLTPDQGLFAKAALYNIQEEDKLYRLLAGDETE